MNWCCILSGFFCKSEAEDFQIPEDFRHGAQLREILEYFRVPFWVGYKCPVRPAKRLCPVDEKELSKNMIALRFFMIANW